jgi:hypothetical protein
MTDTPHDITRIQLEIMLAKSESERFRIGEELISFGRKVLENSIRQRIPGISDIDLKIEVFRSCYSSYYSPAELQKIIVSMKEFWDHF